MEEQLGKYKIKFAAHRMKPLRLNLGCQIHYFDGWVNIDIVGDDPNIKVDLACDVAKLPYEDNTVDFIYAGHLVEHFYPDKLPDIIQEWKRILKRDGKVVIITPDCGAIFRDYATGKFGIEATWQQIYGRIYSYDSAPERHHIAFDFLELAKMIGIKKWQGTYMIKTGGWSQAMPFNFKEPPEELVPFMDIHISRGAYQLGIVLTK